MKHILCICLGIWIFLPGCSLKKKGDKSVQELYDLNKRFVELERSRDQAVYLTESEYANKLKILNDRKFEMENRKNRNSGFFDRIASAVGAEPTEAGKTTEETKNPGLTEKYNILYQVLHGEQDAEFSANRPDVEYTISDSFLRSQTIYPNTNVFGWHPHWMNGAYKSYNFNLLTHVAYFAYDVAPSTGNYRNREAINGWKSTALVDSAHKHNCKVLLTVSNHGRINNEIFLTNPIAQEVLIDSLLFLLRYRDADGIDLNFEAVPQGMSYAFSAFVTKLHGRLALAPKDYVLTVCVPAIDPGVYDVKQLQNYVDFFLIMGYDLHSKRSKIAGPVSPLQNGDTWKGFTLKNSIASYISKGALRQKLILALPYYGAMWETSSPKPGSPVVEFIRHLTYKEIASNYLNNPNAPIKDYADPASDSRYFVFPNPGKDTYTQCWYDDSTTLDTKMDFLQQQGLGGVGFWALGLTMDYMDFGDS